MHISPDASLGSRSHPHGMATQHRHAPQERTRLYDGACDLLHAAQQMRAAASEPSATPAHAATVGCVDAALEALADAIDAMRHEALTELRAARAESPTAVAAVDREFATLVDVLRAAQTVSDRMRDRTGPLLAQLTPA
jgi:hypothetical protein